MLLLERRKYLDFLEIFSLSFSSSWKHFVSSSMGPGQHEFFYLLFISEISAQLLGWTKNSLSRNLVIVIFCSHGRNSTSLRQISGYVAVDFQEYSVKQLPQMLLLNGWSRFTLNFIPCNHITKSSQSEYRKRVICMTVLHRFSSFDRSQSVSSFFRYFTVITWSYMHSL